MTFSSLINVKVLDGIQLGLLLLAIQVLAGDFELERVLLFVIKFSYFLAGEVLVVPQVLAVGLIVEVDGLEHVVRGRNLPRLRVNLPCQTHF